MRALAAVALVLALAPGARAQTPAPATATADPAILAAVRALATDDSAEAAVLDAQLLVAGDAAVEPLTRALSLHQRHITRRAASLLGRLGDAAAVPALLRALAGNSDEDERLELAIAIGRLGSNTALSTLIDLLESGDRSIRLRADVALCRFTHIDEGFRFDAALGPRTAAVNRWRVWLRVEGRDFQIVK